MSTTLYETGIYDVNTGNTIYFTRYAGASNKPGNHCLRLEITMCHCLDHRTVTMNRQQALELADKLKEMFS